MKNQNHPQEAKIGPNWAGRGKSFANVMRMGHCAPTVMQTLLDVSSEKKEWLVRMSAGMPGGIGDSGFECGGVTSPLVLLGKRYGLRQVDCGLPVIFDKGHAYCKHFLTCHKTMNCREIRGNDRFPLHCISPVLRAPELFQDALGSDHQEVIPEERRACYSRLYSHLAENDFHCARTVLTHLDYTPAEHQELFDAVSAFMGGTLFMGRTCSAFSTGVMAIGLKEGEIENNTLRVLRLFAIMTAGGDAFQEGINKFNHSVKCGDRLAKWFVKEYGSTQCQAITQCDFSTPEGVRRYIEDGRITPCKEIAEKVAEKVQQILENGNNQEKF